MTPDPKLCPRQITFTIPAGPGGIPVTVTATEDGAGNLDFTAQVNTTASLTGDLGGLFFQLNDAKLAGLSVTGPAVTLFQTGDDNVTKIAPGINMEGAQPVGYDVGVEFGRAGIGANHLDVTSTSFVVSNAAHNLTLDDFLQAGETNLFGARVTSIGNPAGGRDGSEKITGDATQPITALPDAISTLEDQPVTILASALGTDPNPNGGPLTITEVTQPADGTVTIAPDGSSVTFTPGDFVPNGTDIGSFEFCIKDALGSEDSNTISTSVTPVADPPSIVINSVKAGATVDDTLVTFTANAGDFGTPQQGSDFLQSLSLQLTGNVTSGVTLSDTGGVLNTATDTFNLSGQTQTFTDTVDVKAPSIGAVGPLPLNLADTLSFTAVNEETELTGSPPTATATASQPINIDYSSNTQRQDFTATDQSIWSNGNAFTFDTSIFLGIGPKGLPGHFSGTVGAIVHDPITSSHFGATIGGSVTVTAGFSANLHIDGGSFNADLPFNVTLNDTYNKTTDTLQVDPSIAALPGATLDTTGPGGRFSLDAILKAMAVAHGQLCFIGCTGFNHQFGPTGTEKQILGFNSTTAHFSKSFGGVNLKLAWPTVDTAGGGTGADVMSSGTSGPALSASVDLVSLALAALGIPPEAVKGSIGPLNYDLLSATLGFGIALNQNFNLSDLGLNATLLVGTSQTPEPLGAPIQSVSSLGLNPDGTIPLSLSLSVNNPTLQNVTSIVPEALASLTIGKFSAFGHGGSLFSKSLTQPLATINVFNTTFPVNFGGLTEHATVA
jgi:hypothetical protein